MVNLNIVFWIYVTLFATIGAMRGWAKEMMVTFSVILALFLITVLESYVQGVKNIVDRSDPSTVFWIRSTIVVLLVFFGYQTPNIRGFSSGRFARERLQDILLGFLLGALNGYLIVGTLWYYIDIAGYPFPRVVVPPLAEDLPAIERLLNLMPPAWLGIPWIYFSVGLAFLFVLVVFI